MIAALALLVAVGITPAELETSARAEVKAKFDRAKKPAPPVDDALTAAARSLAKMAIGVRAAEVADLVSVSEAVSAASASDPAPRALVMRSSPPEYALDSLKTREDLVEDPTTHIGIGAAVSGDRGALIVLLSNRKAALAPFPRSFAAAGAVQPLCGVLAGKLGKAEIFVTAPDGAVTKVPLTKSEGQSFCATVPLPKNGRYTVEVIARADRGPEVAALFFTDVGERARAVGEARQPEPTTAAAARAAVLEKVNALRRAHGQKDMVADPSLDAIAQAYGERMSAEDFFSHVAPDGVDMRARMKAAGYSYVTAGENLGSAGGPLAAHFGIEHSPGHRRNLLEPSYTHLGVGVVFKKLADRTQVILVELYAQPEKTSFDPLGDTYAELSKARQQKGLSAIERSEVLEQIARDHAKKALSANTPKATIKGYTPVHERVFEATDFKSAAVDVFVAESLTAVANNASKNAYDPKSDRIGIGAVKGDSQTWGADKYWVVVIYAASR